LSERAIREIVKKYIKKLKEQQILINKVVLFGSYATNKEKGDSDIDLCMVSDSFGKDRVAEGQMLFKVAAFIDPRIEPIPVSSQDYDRDLTDPLLYNIHKEGKILFDFTKENSNA